MSAEPRGRGISQSSVLSPQSSLGVLLIHGFTSSLETVHGLVPHLEGRGIPYALPTLRGHGTRPEDLHGVTWHRWYEDAERALDELLGRCDRVVAMGLSMGGLVALHLGVHRPEALAGVVTVAPALRLTIPAGFLLPLLGRSGRLAAVDVRRAFADAALAAGSTNYPAAPLSAIYSLVRFGRVVERQLPRMRLPLLVLYTPHDRVVRPEGARIVYERAGTPPEQKAIRAFERSGHEMLLDVQREEVFAAIMAFIEERRQAARA
jgi:carboxylesterase